MSACKLEGGPVRAGSHHPSTAPALRRQQVITVVRLLVLPGEVSCVWKGCERKFWLFPLRAAALSTLG